ncbi:MAG: prepilin-type N-terminal cleavage/methylation domain-containing protein [Armatimonadetes bacterium]|nr:prepilin-type N-terminal cleavage/methylation domain-containing protein [Armatimonadota bacterium]NIM23634.1 prepilin-type N-terminal cleavage/methylation domain-containing protein [Armatimonadota bacterium]NIM67501.1 prepilin-type N-terminal cleavage/methylation domain-containing protein [Armatimonadota bacterium]NIM75997.1 prepilin-type N-terminal cleavage/methylation domain-containing protein [Armatimonadota bacterium]NIN05686.1 prepilin-type N-terminal cleavage/methylation domain-contain
MNETAPSYSKRISPRNRRGFTLLELILVCAIIVIVMGVVSASMTGFLARSQLRRSASRLASMAVFARTHAITAGRQVEMRVDKYAGEVALFEQSDDPDQEFSSLGARWRYSLPQNVSISAFEIGGEETEQGSIIFFPEGGAEEAYLVLSLCDSQGRIMTAAEQKQIWVNKITGRLKVE